MKNAAPEADESLWLLAAAPAIWAAHFLLCYVAAAVWCAKFAGPAGPLAPARRAILALTVLALAGIAVIGRGGWRRCRLPPPPLSREFDTDEDRHRFLGFATFLLSVLSAVATVYAAGAAAFMRDCR